MNYKEYLILADAKFPNMNLPAMIKTDSISPPEVVKLIAIECFFTSDIISNLAIETRKQLVSLKDKGVIDFENLPQEDPREKRGYGPSEFI